MTERTVMQIKRMKEQTIGVEVEMNSITRRKAAKTAAEFFGTGRYKDTAGRNGYSTWSAWDADGREWKFQIHFYSGGRFKFEQESVEVWRFRAPLPDARNAREIPFADGEFF